MILGGRENKKRKLTESYLKKQKNIKIEMKWGKNRKMVETKQQNKQF
jgi:hypothetical protein